MAVHRQAQWPQQQSREEMQPTVQSARMRAGAGLRRLSGLDGVRLLQGQRSLHDAQDVEVLRLSNAAALNDVQPSQPWTAFVATFCAGTATGASATGPLLTSARGRRMVQGRAFVMTW